MPSANTPAPPPSLVLSSWASSKKHLIIFSPDLKDLKLSVLTARGIGEMVQMVQRKCAAYPGERFQEAEFSGRS